MKLVEKSGYKHDVIIDNRDVIALVYDCHKYYAMGLCKESLQASMGAFSELDYIPDVRKVVAPGNPHKCSRTQRRNAAKKSMTE